jgi:hypothetical protein
MEPSAPTYLICSGRFPETDVLWLESVVGFGAARERMQRLAAQKPGPYFIFSTNIHVVLATIDSTPAPRAMRRLHSARASSSWIEADERTYEISQ